MVQELDEVRPSGASWALDAVSQVCSQMGCPPDGFKSSITQVSRRDKAGVSLWQWLDVADFSTAKFFIIPDGDFKAVFLVDFLSRHEIIPPMSKDNLPPGWDEWGASKGNSILVCNKNIFLQKILTPDAFLALPPYRFAALADDIEQMVSDGKENVEAVRATLSRGGTGYSFVLLVGAHETCNMEVSVIWSCLNGEIYANSNLLRPTSEQHELRPDE